jgi:hypothetical protein
MDDYVISSLAFGKQPDGFNYFVTYHDGNIDNQSSRIEPVNDNGRVKVWLKTKAEQEAKIAKVVSAHGIDSILEMGEYHD